jgi:hypothetical protein
MQMSQLFVYLRHTLTEEQVYEYFLLNAFFSSFSLGISNFYQKQLLIYEPSKRSQFVNIFLGIAY